MIHQPFVRMMHRKDQSKMVVFDLDTTLLKEQFIDACARNYNFIQALALVRQIDNDAVSLTRRVASFLRDRPKKELIEIADGIPLISDVEEVVRDLRQRSYYVGIISESYQFVAQLVANKIGADFEMANELEFIAGSATGEVLIPSYFHYNTDSTCRHQVCKTNALRHICRQYKTRFEDCIVVGNESTNACMLQHAGEEREIRELLKDAV